jgi:hypothetical protein
MIRTLRPFFGLLAFAALSTGTAFGQANQLPVSRTAGIIDVSLPDNQTTLMALPLVEIVASGTISAIPSAGVYTLVSSPGTLPTDLATSPHAIKITSRDDQRGAPGSTPSGSSTNAYGLTAKITAKSGQDVTAAFLTAPNVGDEYIVYRLETIGSVFGATNAAGLKSASTSASADIIYLDDGAGVLVAYFYRSTASAWRLVSAPSGANQDGAVVNPNRGIIVARKSGGSPVTVRLSGDEMIGREAANVANSSFNIVNNPFTVSTTLAASGLKDFITGGSTSAAADIVYLESGGVLTSYFYRTSASQWRLVSAPSGADQGAAVVAAGKAILFNKKAGSTEFTLPQPFAE